MDLLTIIEQSNPVSDWLDQIDIANKQLITGLSGSAKALVMAALEKTRQQPVMVMVPNSYMANNLATELGRIIGEHKVCLFSNDEVIAAEMAISSPDVIANRIKTMDFLLSGESGMVVVPMNGFRRFLPSPEQWWRAHLTVTVDEELNIEQLPALLQRMGYIRESQVQKMGEYSIRGGIIDIYPLTFEQPVRIELFDTEVESMRYFDVDTQRSLEKVNSLVFPPASDLIFTKEQYAHAEDLVRAKFTDEFLTLDTQQQADLSNYYDELFSNWLEGHSSEADKYYVDYLYEEKTFISDYLSPNGYLLIDDLARSYEVERELLQEEAEWQTYKLEEKRIFNDQKFGGDLRKNIKAMEQSKTYFSLFQKGFGRTHFEQVIPIQYHSMQQFFGQLPLLKTEIERWHKQNQTVVLLVSSHERAIELEKLLIDLEITATLTKPDKILSGELQIVEGLLNSGFELPSEKLVVVNENEIFSNVRKKKRIIRKNISNAERLKSYSDLNPGDYVVHANHGIGRYVGMETIAIEGVHQDYMTIIYQNDDKLFIPVTQLNQIQKYVAAESKTPKINKLGSSEWTKTKRKVAKKIEDIADDLIDLYAKREAEKGFAFSPDNDYQKEFEDAFPYSETEDQLRSIAEIKRDMEKSKPMDRLLVGDVGYGKTEVALRAAFKAIQDNKQVAFLVPTTILAQQHYSTMIERFADFPVEVGLLSRFRTKKQQNETLEKLKKGQVDIVVGTHRVLSKDVEFQDLGLIIIDEEQRFGVKHKERLKQLRSQVDALTLTATPIPRTLHMSMLGVRDLSVIETPPANRYPVQTYVMETNYIAIREATEREMARGGQVFFLYNRVDTIEQKVDELRGIVPDARIAYAHGQMSEIQLENVLRDFLNGEYDVLVTTTIIETGVDMPNVNTLFVDHADKIGLSQLYQLKGRVGRSNRVAYAYFMYEPQKVLSEISEKRLQAIKDFTELGAGFKIAMRDLSIRGAGNLLGAQQHGFIDSVGFDMYSQMLAEAVNRKQGKGQLEAKSEVEINLGVDAYIPGSYIESERQKIEIYKRVRQLENEEQCEELSEDLLDRFGEYPDEVSYLLSVGLLKLYGEYALLESIVKREQLIKFVLTKQGTQLFSVEQIFAALTATKLKATLGMDKDKMSINLALPKDMAKAVWINELIEFVKALREQKYIKK